MMADTVVSESSAGSTAAAGVWGASVGRGLGFRSWGRPMLRLTERCVLPKGDGGFVAAVVCTLRGDVAGGVLKLCMGIAAGADTSSSAMGDVGRVRDARSGEFWAFFGARGCSPDECERRSIPWKSESTPWAIVRSDTFTLLRVTA